MQEKSNSPAKTPAQKGKLLLSLFLTFFKIGACTFGGGYAMIPLIQRDIASKRQWITDDDILEIVAIAESTPGPIAINTATFVGFRIGGFFGAFLATFGVVLPSFAIIVALSFILREFQHIPAVQYAFFGIRAGVLALIIKALWLMYRQCPKSVLAYVLMAAAFVVVAVFHVHILLVIVGCAAVGLVSSLLAERRARA